MYTTSTSTLINWVHVVTISQWNNLRITVFISSSHITFCEGHISSSHITFREGHILRFVKDTYKGNDFGGEKYHPEATRDLN